MATTLAERICMLIQHETGQHNGMNSLRAQIQLLIDANDDPANPDNLVSGKCAGCGEKLVCLDCDGYNPAMTYLREKLMMIHNMSDLKLPQ